jgi:hypothetical protein
VIVHHCTKEHPYYASVGPNEQVIHEGAYEIGEGWDYARMYCPNCNYTWKQELPQ